MRVTLVGIAARYIHQSLAPWCLKAGLKQYGVKGAFRVLELNINQPPDQALEALMDTKPQIAGFSCYIWNIRMVRSLAACLRILSPETVIVLGGPEAGSRPGEIFSEIPQTDYVITGPGEYAFAELVKRLAAKEDFSDIPGLAYRLGGTLRTNPPAALPLPPPSPYTRECLRSVDGRIAYVETARGCPFRCSFCLSGEGRDIWLLPLAKARRELMKAASSGAKTVKLTDRTFNCRGERAYALFRYLSRKRGEGKLQDICFHFEVAADLFDERTLKLLQKAPPGLFQMEAGIQSFHEKTLEACRRKTDLDRLERNIRALLSEKNIHLHVDLIAGLPYEDLGTFAGSFNRAYALGAHMLQLGFLKLLPGSRLHTQREEYGLLHSPEPPYEILQTRWLSYKDISLLKQCEAAVDRFYNSGKFLLTLDLVLKSGGLDPFRLFCRLGGLMAGEPGGLSLERLAELAYAFLAALPGVDKGTLRDAMALDFLLSESGGRLPGCLMVADPRLKQALAALRPKYPPGTKLNAVITYAGGEILHWADYTRRDPVTGRYSGGATPLSGLL